MANWKSNLIEAYRFTTTPYRAWQMQQRRSAGQVPIFVLFYHRISDSFPNPWTLGCREFEQQINWFERHFQIVGLDECQRRIVSGQNTQPTLAITFDDGYAENSEFALPLLVERRIPVTYFVTVDHVLHQRPFAHDIQFGQALPTNSIESLRAISMAGVEIAAHTRNHVDLGKVTDPAQLVDEVITSSRDLEDLIGRPVRYFAFPYGLRPNLNAHAFGLLKQEGFAGACTALGGWNEIGGDAFQISRIHGDPSFSRMKNWLCFDPRLANVLPFDYENAEPYPIPTSPPSPMFPPINLPGFNPTQPLNQIR